MEEVTATLFSGTSNSPPKVAASFLSAVTVLSDGFGHPRCLSRYFLPSALFSTIL